MTVPRPISVSRIAFLALVAVLPLHTVFVRAEIAWKPWLVLLFVVVAFDLWQAKKMPWSRPALVGLVVFLAAALVGWPGPEADPTFWRLWLALAAGGLLLLSTARHAGRLDDVLRVVFWSSAAMGVTGIVLSLVTNGVFGERAVTMINDFVLVDRVNKPAYLESGFIALTNWHQDPGYSALWTNVWLVLSAFAWTRGVVRAPKWVGPAVIGGLVAASVLTYSRTGWIGLVAAIAVVGFAHWRTGAPSFRTAARLLGLGTIVGALLVLAQIGLDRPGVGGDVVTALEFRFSYIGVLGAVDLGEVGVVDPDLVVADNRLEVWEEYWRLYLDSPVRGIGLGTGWSQPGLQEPHNMWLELLAEAGVVGLLGFLFMLSRLGLRGGPIAGSALVVVGLATLSQTVLFEPVLWFVLGLWHAVNLRRSEVLADAESVEVFGT